MLVESLPMLLGLPQLHERTILCIRILKHHIRLVEPALVSVLRCTHPGRRNHIESGPHRRRTALSQAPVDVLHPLVFNPCCQTLFLYR